MMSWLSVVIACLGLTGFSAGVNSPLYEVAYQVMMNSLNLEERIRSEGQSGVKQVRINKGGASPYHSDTHIGNTVISMHEHANNVRTVGMGEIIVVINGVEFRTRHNDYRLVRPNTTSMSYGEVEELEQPEVPPEVTNQPTVELQIAEMKEWFRAHITQNKTHRNYTDYFKPVLCYMEGAWTNPTENLTEPFASDRHKLDATSYDNLIDKIQFTGHTGSKNNGENLAFLPTKFINISSDGTPVMVRWNYRILCHPIQRELPLKVFHAVDDLTNRMMNRLDRYAVAKTRGIRFKLAIDETGELRDERTTYQFLDELMSEIPGANNYPGNISDNAFGLVTQTFGKEPLNAAYYHHVYRDNKKGAMGLRLRRRGFADDSLYVALTNATEIAETCMDDCEDSNQCVRYCQRATYAIPVEIIYLTPLIKWNPYNIKYWGDENSPNKNVPTANGRNGHLTNVDKAYNGTRHNVFYQTPSDFFFTSEDLNDPADTSNQLKGVLDQNGNLHVCAASGPRVAFFIEPNLYYRQRYPIIPIHSEGSTVSKKIDVLVNAVLRSEVHHYLQHNLRPVTLVLREHENKETFHMHDLPELSTSDMVNLVLHGGTKNVTSLVTDNHTHWVTIEYDSYPSSGAHSHFKYDECDGKNFCEHPKQLGVKESPLFPRQAPYL